jgi:hypothetical protein
VSDKRPPSLLQSLAVECGSWGRAMSPPRVHSLSGLSWFYAALFAARVATFLTFVATVDSLQCPRRSPDCRSLVSCNSSSFCRESDPVQSLVHHLSRLSDLSTGPTFPEVLWPFNGILERAPLDWSRLSRQLRVPLPGFLNPSAASKQVRVPGLYFMPQPFLNFPFRAFPSQRSCTPLEAHQLPCGHPPCVRKRVADGLITSDFPDSHV